MENSIERQYSLCTFKFTVKYRVSLLLFSLKSGLPRFEENRNSGNVKHGEEKKREKKKIQFALGYRIILHRFLFRER